MAVANPHVLLETPDEPDCRFVAAWLFRAAQAQSFWQALGEGEFAEQVSLLYVDGDPDLAAFALQILGELEHQHHVVALDLYSDDIGLISYEFALLERLGFFVYGSQSYWMAVPKTITLAAVRRAALEVLSTVEDDGDGIEIVWPERLMLTLSKMEAGALRAKLIALRRFSASHHHYGPRHHFGPKQ
jgi:hypothetical protein